MVMWIIVYLVAGFGVYWLINREDEKIKSKINESLKDDEDYQQMKQWKLSQKLTDGLSKTPVIMIIAALIVGIAVWALWPLIAIGMMIYHVILRRNLNNSEC